MRNPNGYGSVYKLSGNRRNPYTARITIGFKKTEKSAQPIYKFLGFYKTKKEAAIALALYNENPEAVVTVNNTLTPTSKITLIKVYEEWSEEHYPTLKKSSHYVSAFKVLEPLYNHSFASLKINDYEKVFISSGKNQPVLKVAKISLKLMYQYAFRKGYITESLLNIPSYISIATAGTGKREDLRKPFKHEEITELWKHKDDQGVQVVLFMIYTGLRISELISLKKSDVHYSERYFDVRASKTEAGVRKVPINEKIAPFVEEWLQGGNDYLVPLKGNKPSVKAKAPHNGFDDTLARYNMPEHTQHDTRHTCTTLLTEALVDERLIKLIMGHAQHDVTNRVYANKLDISVLVDAINQIQW